MFNIFFYEKRALDEIMCEKCGRDKKATADNIIRRMGVTFLITKAKNTHNI
jgi:hypothetical protein